MLNNLYQESIVLLNSERQQACGENLDNEYLNFSKSEIIELKSQNGDDNINHEKDLNEEDLKFEIVLENGKNERASTNIEERQTD